jgi:uncharacterized spore protein YtfJ
MEPRELLEALAARVRELASSEMVVGTPIVLGEVTIVPITRVTIGFGGGSGSGEANEGAKPKAGGTGGGGGGGVRISPAAFVVLQAGEVQVLAAPGKRGALADVFERVPDLVEKLMARQQAKAAPDDAD